MNLLRCLSIVLLVAWSALCSARPIFDPFSQAGIEQLPGAQLPLELSMTDLAGNRIRLAELAGDRPVILAPIYYLCPNVCGAQLSSLFNLLQALPYQAGEDYQLIAFSFDPRETAADARAEQERLARRWPQLAHSEGVHFLTGEAEAILKLTEAIGFRFAWDDDIQQYAHVSALAILDPGGRMVRWLYGLGYQPDDMRLALTDAGKGKVGSFGDQLLLLCYHYNPRTGGYDNWIIGALQVGGVGTALGLGGFIGMALWRERRRRGGPHG